jgi:hypothetical protein
VGVEPRGIIFLEGCDCARDEAKGTLGVTHPERPTFNFKADKQYSF